MKGIRRKVAVGPLQRRVEGLVVMAELLQHPRALFEEAFFKMSELLLVHLPFLPDFLRVDFFFTFALVFAVRFTPVFGFAGFRGPPFSWYRTSEMTALSPSMSTASLTS